MMSLDAFLESVASEVPPTGVEGPLLGLWYAAKGDWEKAHDSVRLDESADAAWVHAHLHRVEGDLDNARYWYGQAGQPFTTVPLNQERVAIAEALLFSQE